MHEVFGESHDKFFCNSFALCVIALPLRIRFHPPLESHHVHEQLLELLLTLLSSIFLRFKWATGDNLRLGLQLILGLDFQLSFNRHSFLVFGRLFGVGMPDCVSPLGGFHEFAEAEYTSFWLLRKQLAAFPHGFTLGCSGQILQDYLDEVVAFVHNSLRQGRLCLLRVHHHHIVLRTVLLNQCVEVRDVSVEIIHQKNEEFGGMCRDRMGQTVCADSHLAMVVFVVHVECVQSGCGEVVIQDYRLELQYHFAVVPLCLHRRRALTMSMSSQYSNVSSNHISRQLPSEH